jgi:hypothetical protein
VTYVTLRHRSSGARARRTRFGRDSNDFALDECRRDEPPIVRKGALGEDWKRLRAMNRLEAPNAFSPDRVTCRIAELAAPLGVSVKAIKRKVADATLQLTQALGVCRAGVQRRVA